MTRLIQRGRARRMDSQNLQTNTQGSPHSAAPEDENGSNSNSGELIETSTPGVHAATSTDIESQQQINTEGSHHSAASEDENGHNPDSGESIETSEIPAAPGGVREATSTHIESLEERVRKWIKDDVYRCALKGNWDYAEKCLRRDPTLASDPITEGGDTALHIAAANKHVKFVQELVERMNPTDLSLQNKAGETAFLYAAASGIVDIASVMIDKNQSLLTIGGTDQMTPLQIAISFQNREMVSFLLERTPLKDLPQKELFELLMAAIRSGMYGAALKILMVDPHRLATMTDDIEGTALHLLAQRDIPEFSFLEGILDSITDKLAILRIPGMQRIVEKGEMRRQVMILALEMWSAIQTLETEEKHKLINHPPILLEAVKAGNVGFITSLTYNNPDIIWITDSNNYTLFHYAVIERQECVFRLIHQLGIKKPKIASLKDKDGNNILHLAGKKTHGSRSKHVYGAALQMQRELLWFQEMEKILPQSASRVKNKDGLRPRELFSKEHEGLLKDGELWMRETADSCMLIATIMLTVAFAAAFTVPGGNNSELGTPLLLKKSGFIVFMAFDAVAMFCSTISIMMFLSILTSRFHEDDFLVSLPLKLLFGLAGLLGSLVATVSTFTSANILMLNERRARLLTGFGSSVCSIIALIFLFQHFGLILGTLRSIYLSRYLFRPDNRHSLYGKYSLEHRVFVKSAAM